VTRPAGWRDVEDKFLRLAVPVAGRATAARIVRTVRSLERARVEDLCSLLGSAAPNGGVEHA